jgi:hypothetical protein
MNYPFCPHEEKVAAMLKKHAWPGAADPALQEHAKTCTRCREVAFAVEMLQRSRASAMASSPTLSPGHIWWRAQLRRKSGVAAKLARPVVWAEGLALASMLFLIACFGFWHRAELVNFFSSFIGISILAGLTAILCVGGLTLFLSDKKS